MGQISKFAVLAGFGALLAATAPVLARSSVVVHTYHRGNAGINYGHGYAAQAGLAGAAAQGYFSNGVGSAFYAGGYYRHGVYQPGFPGRSYGYGGGYGDGGSPVAGYPYFPQGYYPPFYPVGYDGGHYDPTGYGVIYNIPPNPPLHFRQGPHIITLSGRHRHCHRGLAHGRPITIVRGGEAMSTY